MGVNYLSIILMVLLFLLAAYLFYLMRVIKSTIKQMEEIRASSVGNRQLRAISANKVYDKLLKSINDVYEDWQQERIIAQKKSRKVRQEIENISHDLRTPLTSIIGYVDLCKDKQITEEEKTEYLHIIQKRARVLQSFIMDFYEISRMEGDSFPLEIDRLAVQNTLGEIIVAYYHEMEQKKLNVEVNLEEKQCFILVDKIQFHRVINNLIQNAIKYARKNISLQQFTTKDECIIQIKNEKNQMKEEELKLIYDRFYTGDISRTSGSTGLGLTISKLLVEKMQGNIRAFLEEDFFVIELRWKIH